MHYHILKKITKSSHTLTGNVSVMLLNCHKEDVHLGKHFFIFTLFGSFLEIDDVAYKWLNLPSGALCWIPSWFLQTFSIFLPLPPGGVSRQMTSLSQATDVFSDDEDWRTLICLRNVIFIIPSFLLM